MAKTSLRAYDREIESLIEQNQFEQAIAHAKHILKFYPKHIQTYRLLGKAYLESQRYGDAADVFQRVISAIPDDFVSHVGMSIIREDEGNLDVAIWHMERAFEIQPANSAIQGELRRLYGKRDGVEPPKVRLTRGALARMYMKGELYQQAIAELRAALAEDPQRPDLLAMLAPAYFLTGQRVEAADTCSQLLKKAPFCLEANRILAEILANTERSSEAQVCRQRVHALDPYAAQISPAAPSPERVPDNAVSLEKLVWSPGQPVTGLPGQPEWASSLGLNLGEAPKEEESEPDWLSDQPEKEDVFEPEASTPGIVPPFATGEQPPDESLIQPEEEDQIPEWMKSAGWEPSTGAEEEVEVPPTVFDDTGILLPEPDEIEQGEIPEWLQAIAPPQSEPEENLPNQPEGELEGHAFPSESDALSWLEETPPGPTDSVVTWLDEKEPLSPETPQVEAEAEAAVEIPDWLKDMGEPESGTQQAIESETEDVEEVYKAQEDLDTHELPGWLAAGRESGEETPTDEPPDWLKIDESEEVTELQPEQPDWLKETPEEAWKPSEEEELPAEQPIPESKLQAGSEDDEAFAWLESLAAKQGADEALLLSPEERREEPPEWILEASQAERVGPTPSLPAEEAAAIPEWLQEGEPVAETTPEAIPGSTPETGEPAPEGVPEWLQEGETVAEAAPKIEPEIDLEPEEADDKAVPEWLNEFESLANEEGEVAPETGEELVLPSELEVSELTTEIPFEGSNELEENLPEAEPGELPDWLREIPETPVEEIEPGMGSAATEADLEEGFELPTQEMAEESLASVEETFEATPGEELPDWLKEPEEQVEPGSELSELPTLEELPSWLAGAEETPGMEMLFSPQAISDTDIELTEEERLTEAPGELISDTQPTRIHPSETVEEPTEAEVQLPVTAPLSHEVPDWVKELDKEEQQSQLPEQAQEEPAGVPVDDEAAFAWLEGLAARMGADEALLLNPEERTEEPPEWIQKEAEAAVELPMESMEVSETEQVSPVEEPLPEASQVEVFEEEATPEEPMEAELQAPTEAIAEEIELPIPETPIETMEITEELQAVEAEATPEITEEVQASEPEALPEIEELPETFAPTPGVGIEEVEPEVPPELPSWLADVDQVEAAPEAEDWISSEEAQLEATIAAGLGTDSLVAQEGTQPTEAEAPKIDLNQAGLADLERLPGMGFTRAQAVLSYRQESGPFKDLDELLTVPGLDAPLVESLKNVLTISEIQPTEQLMEGMDASQVTLIQARNALAQGESSQAVAHYVSLIKDKQLLPDVIQDLNEALYRFPVDISIWEALGDAHMRSGRLQDALDAYTKAEELIR